MLTGLAQRVVALFPRVGERLAQRTGTVDEPSAGLAPVLVQAVLRALREIHAEGTTILLVEQNVPLSLRLAQRAYRGWA